MGNLPSLEACVRAEALAAAGAPAARQAAAAVALSETELVLFGGGAGGCASLARHCRAGSRG